MVHGFSRGEPSGYTINLIGIQAKRFSTLLSTCQTALRAIRNPCRRTSPVIFYERRKHSLPNVKILLVDDSPSDCNVLSLALSSLEEEIEIEIVTDGFTFSARRATKLIPASSCWISISRGTTAFEVLRAIREEPVLSHIHVVILTGAATRGEITELNRMARTTAPSP